MPRWRVKVNSEAQFIVDVDAATSTEAGTKVCDLVRAGKLEPLVVGIAEVDIRLHRHQPEEK